MRAWPRFNSISVYANARSRLRTFLYQIPLSTSTKARKQNQNQTNICATQKAHQHRRQFDMCVVWMRRDESNAWTSHQTQSMIHLLLLLIVAKSERKYDSQFTICINLMRAKINSFCTYSSNESHCSRSRSHNSSIFDRSPLNAFRPE